MAMRSAQLANLCATSPTSDLLAHTCAVSLISGLLPLLPEPSRSRGLVCCLVTYWSNGLAWITIIEWHFVHWNNHSLSPLIFVLHSDANCFCGDGKETTFIAFSRLDLSVRNAGFLCLTHRLLPLMRLCGCLLFSLMKNARPLLLT